MAVGYKIRLEECGKKVGVYSKSNRPQRIMQGILKGLLGCSKEKEVGCGKRESGR